MLNEEMVDFPKSETIYMIQIFALNKHLSAQIFIPIRNIITALKFQAPLDDKNIFFKRSVFIPNECLLIFIKDIFITLSNKNRFVSIDYLFEGKTNLVEIFIF